MLTLLGLLILVLSLWLFFLPSYLARKTQQHSTVTLLNVFFGTSGAGWVLGMILALHERRRFPRRIHQCLDSLSQWVLRWQEPLSWAAGIIFITIWDFKRYKRTKVFLDLSVWNGDAAHLWDIVSLKWLPMIIQLLVLLILARFFFKKIPLTMIGSLSLILVVLSFIQPPGLFFFTVVWLGFFLYGASSRKDL